MCERQPKTAIAGDLLYGAAAISEFLFGTPNERRRVYTLDTAGAIPTFSLARVLCARRSSMAAAIVHPAGVGDKHQRRQTLLPQQIRDIEQPAWPLVWIGRAVSFDWRNASSPSSHGSFKWPAGVQPGGARQLEL
jgi:hypothetical protein